MKKNKKIIYISILLILLIGVMTTYTFYFLTEMKQNISLDTKIINEDGNIIIVEKKIPVIKIRENIRYNEIERPILVENKIEIERLNEKIQSLNVEINSIENTRKIKGPKLTEQTVLEENKQENIQTNTNENKITNEIKPLEQIKSIENKQEIIGKDKNKIIYQEDGKTIKCIQELNEKGEKVKETNYTNDGKNISSIRENGNTIKITNYIYKNNKQIIKNICEYDNKFGKIFKETIYKDDGITIKNIHEYERDKENGNIIKITSYENDRTIYQIDEFNNKNNKLIKKTIYDKNGETIIYEYNKRENESKKTIYHSNGTIKYIKERKPYSENDDFINIDSKELIYRENGTIESMKEYIYGDKIHIKQTNYRMDETIESIINLDHDGNIIPGTINQVKTKNDNEIKNQQEIKNETPIKQQENLRPIVR